jgi:hypothetical protein
MLNFSSSQKINTQMLTVIAGSNLNLILVDI